MTMTTLSDRQTPGAKDAPAHLTNRQLGLLVAMASWGMLFGTFILSFLLYRARMPVWPPLGTEAVPPLLPTIATGLLFASSFFIHVAYRQLLSRESKDFKRFWGIGTFLGFLFLVLQAGTWNHMVKMGMTLQSNFFASIYYTLTGLHAVHVVGGLAWLGWVWFRADRFIENGSTSIPQLSGWFWHFMDALWLLMFVLLVLV